jgi:hypothetical protein
MEYFIIYILKRADLITFEKRAIHHLFQWISTLKNKIMKLTLKKELPLIGIVLLSVIWNYVTEKGADTLEQRRLINGEINTL